MVLPTTTSTSVSSTTSKPASASQPNTSENQQVQSTSESQKSLQAKVKSDLSSLLLPVQVQQKQTPVNAQVNITIQEQQYQLSKTAELQKILHQATQIVISHDQAKQLAATARLTSAVELAPATSSTTPTSSTAQASGINIKPISTQLILLAQTVQFALPQPLTDLATQNGVSTTQLAALASRAQGYPLPTAQISQGQLTFTDGPSLKLPIKTVLNDGQYLAKVVLNQQQLQLALTPVIGEIKVDLLKQAPILTPQQQANIVVTKNEPAQILSQFLKKLESIPLPNTNTPTTNDIGKLHTQTTQPSSTAAGSSIGDKNANIPASNINLTESSKTKIQNPLSARSPIAPQQEVSNTKSEQHGVNLKTDGVNIAGAKHAVNHATSQSVLPAGSSTSHKPSAEFSSQQTVSVNKDPQPIEVLNKALSKAGAMPIKQQHSLQLPNSLASELLKHLPQISPHPLSALSDPHLLSQELLSLAGLNLTQSQAQSNSTMTSTLYSGGAITTLFQLLLGVKANTSGLGMSAKLQEHLNQLQQRTLAKLTGNAGLLSALDKLGGADSLAQLASSIAMYQQASTDPNQSMTWYFALPYSINQRDEQFEGKFEQENPQDKDNNNGWKLQLKFNLAQGSLLICAHKKDDKLDIQFKGNSQALLAKVNSFNGSLANKISQIGLTPGTFSTQLTQIPATLLPGDHYLVKTRA